MRNHLKSPHTDGLGDTVENQAEMTSRWVVRQCSYCDEHGYLPNGFRCHHEPPETAVDRARRGAELARAELRAARERRNETEEPA